MSRIETPWSCRGSGETGVVQDKREPVRAPASDDKAMLKAAADLTRDLNVAKPAIYWADLIGSAAARICRAVRGHDRRFDDRSRSLRLSSPCSRSIARAASFTS